MLALRNLVVAGVVGVAAFATPALAAQTVFPVGSPFTGAHDPFTGFPTCQLNLIGTGETGSGGPLGVLDDGSHFFVVDLCNETTYRFPTTGGIAGLASKNSDGLQYAVVVDDGTYFGATGADPAGVYQLNPTTLALGPSFAIPSLPDGMAVDPQTGDLYVAGSSSLGGGGIYRVQNPASADPTVTTVATDPFGYDGIAISADGTRLYGARSDQHVVGFGRDGLGFGGPPVLDVSLASHGPDGVAVAPPNTTVVPNGGGAAINISNNVFVNSNDGTIEMIDVNHSNVSSVVALGGTRGDFTTVGPDGCLYATQASSVEKLTPCLFVQKITADGSPITAVEGKSATTTVARFTDPNTAIKADAFTATIDWGDGSSSTGAVSGGDGSFTVTGTHTYPEEGSYVASVTVTETAAPADTATVTSGATVTDAALTAGTLTTSAGTEGVTPGGVSFTFTDANPGATVADYSATVTWGDGSTSAGGVSGPTGGPFKVTASHMYGEEGSNPVQVSVLDDGGSSTSASGSVTVADAPIAATCATPQVSPQKFSGAVANLTDQNPGGTTADFTAKIQWGDGTTSSGTLSGATGDPFTVSGSHSYATTGPETITTSISDDGGSTAKTTCNVVIFQFVPFVIGDRNSAPGTAVTFWGAQWAKLNSLSAGPAPDSFKGYAKEPANAPTACGVSWTTRPGNSPPPPKAKLPAFMGLIVASRISKSGSVITGDTKHIVVVKTNPGYEPNPGHAGTGVVQAQYC